MLLALPPAPVYRAERLPGIAPTALGVNVSAGQGRSYRIILAKRKIKVRVE
jgi:hypothetical protein